MDNLQDFTLRIIHRNDISETVSRLDTEIRVNSDTPAQACMEYMQSMIVIVDRLLSDYPEIADFLPVKQICSFDDVNIYTAETVFNQRLYRVDRTFGLLFPQLSGPIHEVTDFLICNIDKDVKLVTAAEWIHLTPKYLSTLFHHSLGVTFSEYARRLKIERAKVLLSENGLKVYEVAQKVGFSDEQYFSRVFRNMCGQKPSSYIWNAMDDVFKDEGTAATEDSSEIRIGAVCCCSGKNGYMNQSVPEIYRMCVDEFNAAGGIDGKPVRLFVRDYADNPDNAGELAEDLIIRDKVNVIMGGFLSSAREKIRHVCDKYKILYFYDSYYEGGVADHYTFVMGSMLEQTVLPVVNYLMNHRRARTFFIVSADYNFGILSGEYSKYCIQQLGGEVLALEYAGMDKDGYDITIENIQNKDPDVLILFLIGDNQFQFFNQWHRKNKKPIPIITLSVISQAYLHLKLPQGVLDNVWFSAPFTQELKTQDAQAFISKIRKSGRNIPYVGCDEDTAWLSMQFYKKAVEECHRIDSEAIIRTLENGEQEIQAPGGRASINPADHHLIRDVHIFRVDELNHVHIVETIPNVSSRFVSNILEKSYGVKHGLRDLGKNSPNVQYNYMFYRL
jgi:urea transport system substrate-binding protein